MGPLRVLISKTLKSPNQANVKGEAREICSHIIKWLIKNKRENILLFVSESFKKICMKKKSTNLIFLKK